MTIMSSLKSWLQASRLGLSSQQVEQILQYYQRLLQGNELQNLTRLIEERDFFEGHFLDVEELCLLRWVQGPAMDLGSGAGVPGLLAALVDGQKWVLCESEKRKAEFLESSVQALGLDQRVSVASVRAELYLKNDAVDSIVSRAVGPLSRIYSWVHTRSTWNRLILLKGPRWDEEWQEFERGKFRKELMIRRIHRYEVGPEKKQRLIVQLDRV